MTLQNGCITYSTMTIKVLYLPKKLLYRPKTNSGYAPASFYSEWHDKEWQINSSPFAMYFM